MTDSPKLDSAAQEAHQRASEVADVLRGVFALLYLSEWRGGPRMNYECCAAGLGLITSERTTEPEPPAWLVETLTEMFPPTAWDRIAEGELP